MNRREFLKTLASAPLVPLVAVAPVLTEKALTSGGNIIVKRGAKNAMITGNSLEGGDIIIEDGTDGTLITSTLLRKGS
jgi:uncharacterized protein with beta-barrel porin domain